jgi:putative endopeptidase
VVGGFTGDQRFYLGWAQMWRMKYREPALRRQLLSDPHPPGEQRADIVRNRPEWYAAFNVAPGDRLYLAPAQRADVW